MSILIATIFEKQDIKKTAEAGADAFIFGVKGFSTKIQFKVELNQIEEIVIEAKNNHVKCYLALNVMIHNELIEPLRGVLKRIETLQIEGIYVTDLAMFDLMNERNLIHKLIYNPDTTITNYYDAMHWYQKGILAVTVSKEITLEDLVTIGNYFEGNKEVVVHGRLNMFSSKRMLIENFLKYSNKEYTRFIENYDMYLIEEIRDGKMPILQDDFGTHIFTDYTLQSLKEISILSQNGYNMFRIDGIFRNIHYVCDIIRIYRLILDGTELDIQNTMKELTDKYNDQFGSGFYYKKTTYVK